MSIIDRLACRQDRNDEKLNIELARYLCSCDDFDGVAEIIAGFKGKDKAVANDCIKVLYEAGKIKPELIAKYADDFLLFLNSKNNRLAWGSMIALASITQLVPEVIFANLHTVVSAYESGSVITVDNSISVFAKLCKADARYSEKVLPILTEHLRKCRPKDMAQHAERASLCFNPGNADIFKDILEKRAPFLTLSQQQRVKKLLKTLDSAGTS